MCGWKHCCHGDGLFALDPSGRVPQSWHPGFCVPRTQAVSAFVHFPCWSAITNVNHCILILQCFSGSDLFLNSQIHTYLEHLLKIYCRPANLDQLDLNQAIPGLASFYDLFVSYKLFKLFFCMIDIVSGTSKCWSSLRRCRFVMLFLAAMCSFPWCRSTRSLCGGQCGVNTSWCYAVLVFPSHK
jgi:hypothetical protein